MFYVFTVRSIHFRECITYDADDDDDDDDNNDDDDDDDDD